MSIGNKIKESRNKMNLTQKELADQLHVSRQTISNWEVERSYPDIESLILLSDIFNLSIDKLLKEDEKMVSSLKKKSVMDFLYFSIMIALCIGSITSLLINIIINHHLSWSLIVLAACLISIAFISVFKYSHSYHLSKASCISLIPFSSYYLLLNLMFHNLI